ncbi:hypothetical protein A1O3_06868 [Capronia epimyces CBS 606.96]|uniref:Uncharacterized protein n=1 Tax=Capronia epimyces CBS 606.96 TaxID=1182542 RepID=W9Y1D8_9EURO|nr:uncharacterized protein A1O3_06868 [Capronia epimyces CBS 606.96]EXJ83051.1 hypothetical protein A1O3_06868 [Capronia epimyces CBS 606.96]
MSPARLKDLGLVVTPEAALVCQTCRHALPAQPAAVRRHLRQTHLLDRDGQTGLDELASRTLTDIAHLQPRSDESPEDPLLRTAPGFWAVSGSTARRAWIVSPASDRTAVAGAKRKASYHYGQRRRTKKVTVVAPARQRALLAQVALPAALLTSHERERRRLLPSSDLSPARVPHQLDQIVATTPWLQRTAWIELFGRAPRDVLATMTQYPGRASRTDGLDLGTVDGREFRIPGELHPIVFQPEQQNLLSRIWEILESSSQPTHAHPDIDDGDVESDSESEYENDGFDESDEESDEESDTRSDIDKEDSLTTDSAPLSPLASTPSFLDDPLTRLIYQFNLSLCMDEFHDGQPASSPFIVLTGIFGLTPKGDGY